MHRSRRRGTLEVMSEERQKRTVRRVSDEDLEPWQRELVEDSRRRSAEEKAFADDARSAAAAAT